MSRLLVAGCGYVGLATARLFREHGWEVLGWTATAESADRLRHELGEAAAVNLADAAEVQKAAPSTVDAVIHCASTKGGEPAEYRDVYLRGCENLARAFPQRPILFTSSTSVYGQADGSWVTEESPAEPAGEKARILRAAEEVVLRQGGYVARLAGIYGPGRSHMLASLRRGEARLDPGPDRFLNQVHRDDIAAAIWFLLADGRGNPGIYNVADNEPLPRNEALRWLARELDLPEPPAGESPGRRRSASNKRVSNRKLRAAGWSPRFPDFQTAMRESILAEPPGEG